MTARDDIEPDDKDWTWVLGRPCPDCGFDAAAVRATDVAVHIRTDAVNWLSRLERPGVTERPQPGVWSVLEYGCHVRDVHRIFDHRVHLMLDEDAPHFPNWDQDETAVADDYASQRPDTVAAELAAAAETVANTYAAVHADAWSRRGLRSNGSEFTVATIAVYHLHDIVHHAWDVDSAV
ncbi:DinB family protein [Mycolicibacterium sp. P9-64]|uniref:DinB family protein n=1 Tax=Mycolicibacterium sp. P9-64 TaxID=2024612 RepID=UPI0011EF11F8|nr:DinB family protein [Mycolicibacterium sp. P9-64]KAA0084405.1 DinB family protein [Mycolicibacterium sp. P9-64]